MKLGQAQLRAKVQSVDRQCPIKRAAFAFAISSLPVRVGKVAPQWQRIGVSRGGAGEGCGSSHRIAAAQGGKPFVVGLLGKRDLVHGPEFTEHGRGSQARVAEPGQSA